MKLSELIKQAQEALDKHGDMDCRMNHIFAKDLSKAFASPEESDDPLDNTLYFWLLGDDYQL